jgi:hypothetical protein
MNIVCPLPAALTPMPAYNCPFHFDQIVRILFQRRQDVATPPFPTLADIQSLLDWETFIAAVDSTKVVASPLFSGLVIPSSEALTAGGNDNSTIGGIPDYNGEGAVTPTGMFKGLPPVVKRALEALVAESLAGSTGISNLTAYFVNKDGIIYAHNPVDGAGAATTIYQGVPITNYRIGSVGSEGLNAKNINPFSFSMLPNWADYLAAIKPAFDPLTEI